MSDLESIYSDDVSISEELQKELEDAMKQCAEIEILHKEILAKMEKLHITIGKSDRMIVSYQGKTQDLNVLLDGVYEKMVEHPNANLGSTLLSILESCEFK